MVQVFWSGTSLHIFGKIFSTTLCPFYEYQSNFKIICVSFSVFCEPFGSFVFYPCQDLEFVTPGQAKSLKEHWDNAEVENTSILFHRRPEANILMWKKRSDPCSDSLKLDWIKENAAQLVKTLGYGTSGMNLILMNFSGAPLGAIPICVRAKMRAVPVPLRYGYVP